MNLDEIKTNQHVTVKLSSGKSFEVLSNLRTEVEVTYFKHGGILPFVMRKKL
jgi:aconitate hydratase